MIFEKLEDGTISAKVEPGEVRHDIKNLTLTVTLAMSAQDAPCILADGADVAIGMAVREAVREHLGHADRQDRLLDATLEVPMRAVESSNIAAIGHAAGVTQIEFKNGGAYRYHDEGGSAHMRLADAKSVGKTFHQFRGAMQAQGCAKLNGAVWTLLGK